MSDPDLRQRAREVFELIFGPVADWEKELRSAESVKDLDGIEAALRSVQEETRAEHAHALGRMQMEFSKEEQAHMQTLRENDLAVQHARKQGGADGFQDGWKAALTRVEAGDSVQELRQLVPDTNAFYRQAFEAGQEETREAYERTIHINIEVGISGKLGVGAEVWAELTQVEEKQVPQSRSVVVGALAFKTAMNALRHCGLKHYTTPSERLRGPQ